MKKYVLAIDEGTTSARAIVFDKQGNIVSSAQKEFKQIYPQPGFVEHDALEIYAAQYATMTEAVLSGGISPKEIAAIGITNQRETTILWDKNTGKPIYNAIVWQCRRTAQYCEELKSQGLEEKIKEKTGLPVDAYFSATKIKWLLDNVDGAKEKAENGELLFGTVDTWLVWKLTGGKLHITDYTNASRTMLFNINTLSWDSELLNLFGIPASILPKVVASSEIYTDIEFLGEKIALSGIAGDQQAALYGQCCFNKGDIKNTYGTGCFLLMNCGEQRITSKHGLISTIAASKKGEPIKYALEGSVFVGGAVIQWLRDELGFIRESNDSEYFANKVENSGGVYVVPAFAGLGAPYWDMYARGTVLGLTRGSSRNHIIRASLESIAYQTNDLIESIKEAGCAEIKSLNVDGGASKNNLLMQFQADISALDVVRSQTSEATALGAAFLAGCAVGFFENEEELLKIKTTSDIFKSNIKENDRNALIKGWKKAVKCARMFGEDE